MGALPKPEVGGGPLCALFDALHELHHRAGWPSLRDMSREVGCSHTTVSAAFSEPRLPRWGLLELIVETLGGDTDEFHRLWLAASSPGTRSRRAVDVLPIPRDLPADVVGFTGRDTQLAELDDVLAGADGPAVRVAAVTGTAGVGKTALAVHWAHCVADQFPDGQIYLNLRGYDPDRPVQPVEALESVLRELGVDGAVIPQDVAQRAARYRTLLAGRRMLVLLDNARSVDQIRDLLPGDPSCFVLVTSRDALPSLVARHGAQRINLDVLTTRDSLALLRTLIGTRVDTERDTAEELTACCARLPLALRIVAELAMSRRRDALTVLLEEFKKQAGRLDLLDAGDDEYTAVRTVFSWSLRQLTGDVGRAFRLLGLHPGADTDLGAAAALFGTDPHAALRLLDALVRAHLVGEDDAGRFGMHDLLRAYAAERAGELPDDERHAALVRLAEHYLTAAGAAVSNADRAWLAAERPNLIAVALATADELPRTTIGFAETLTRYLDVNGYYGDALVLDERALASARAAGDPGGEATMANVLGGVYDRLGRYAESLPLRERALVVHRELGDRAGEGRALNGLGVISWRSGRYAEACERLHDARQVFVEIGDPAGEANVLYVLGAAEFKVGRAAASIEHLERAVQINRDIGERTGEGRALNNLGEVYLRLGRLTDAASCYRSALAIARERGNRAGEGVALCNLATVAQQEERLDDALDGYAQALAICREVGYRIGHADALRGVGVVYRHLGRYDEAVEHLQMAIDMADEIGEADVRTCALNELGDTLLAAGRTKDAARVLGRALSLAEQTSDPYEQARAHAGLAASIRGRTPAKARRHAQLATAAFARLGIAGDPEANRPPAVVRMPPSPKGQTDAERNGPSSFDGR